jgi:hypothetical protein
MKSIFDKMQDKLDKYNRKSGADIQRFTKDSLDWYMKFSRGNLANLAVNPVMRSSGNKVARPKPGLFYMFRYDPKHKDNLPYYDTAPVILCTSITPDGWYGINVHYMPLPIRVKVMSEFYKTLYLTKNDNERLRMNWAKAETLCRSISKTKYLSHSIKRYLVSQLDSPLIKIDSENWDMITFLPLAKFKKAKESAVWKDV